MISRILAMRRRGVFISLIFLFILTIPGTILFSIHHNADIYSGTLEAHYGSSLMSSTETSSNIDNDVRPAHESLTDLVSPSEKYTRKLSNNSPFKHIERNVITSDTLGDINDNENGNLITLQKWKDDARVTKFEKCKLLIESIYAQDNAWTNKQCLKKTEDENEADSLLSIFAERLRIYNYCFLSNDITPSDIFNANSKSMIEFKDNLIKAKDFQYRMFPFLKRVSNDEVLLPNVIDLTTMQTLTFTLKMSISEHNSNFWKNWMNMSQGKGIITTFSPEFTSFFYKSLQVLKYLGNDLPIQILVHENEFSEAEIERLSKAAIEAKQKIYLVTYTNLIEPDYLDPLKKFNNKFLAALFNTFEEYIFLDADAVSFIKPSDYFEIDEYKTAGHYMFRDRELGRRSDERCIRSFRRLEPSLEEVTLIDTTTQYTFDSIDNRTATGRFMELYFKESLYFLAESGLIVTHKKTNFFGTLMSTMMTLNNNINKCSHGDKESFWLGHLYAGLPFNFEPSSAALMGFPKKKYDENGRYIKTSLCDTHIAHAHNGTLIWTNGCLTKSKNGRGGPLKGDEISRMEYNGFLISDRKHGLWVETSHRYAGWHCADAVEVGSKDPTHGFVGWFDAATFEKMDTISKLWFDAKLPPLKG